MNPPNRPDPEADAVVRRVDRALLIDSAQRLRDTTVAAHDPIAGSSEDELRRRAELRGSTPPDGTEL